MAALTLLSIGATHGSPALRTRPSCAFNLPLNAAQCQRLHAATGGAGASWASSGTSSTLLYTSEPFDAAVDIWTVTAKALKSSGRLELGAGAVPLGLTVDTAQNLYVAIGSLGWPHRASPSFHAAPRNRAKPTRRAHRAGRCRGRRARHALRREPRERRRRRLRRGQWPRRQRDRVREGQHEPDADDRRLHRLP